MALKRIISIKLLVWRRGRNNPFHEKLCRKKKGYENIELLEDCELYKLKIDNLIELYLKDIHIANWGRKLAETELLKLESRMISSEFSPSKERYDELMNSFPSPIQRVPLKYIASYLGITQVSLSRIRKQK